MALYQWDDALSVGNVQIDNDHKHLMELVIQLHDAMRTGKGRDVVGNILEDLINYTHSHFEMEEKFMREINYSEYEAHKAEHARLVKEVTDLQTRFKTGNITITVSVSNFLSDWLRNHILGLDQKLANAIKLKNK